MIRPTTALAATLTAALTCGGLVPAWCDVRLPEVLADHMVLEQNADVALWGWAYVGETVIIETSWGVTLQTKADAHGEWRVTVKTPPATPLSKGLHPEHITFTAPGENSVQIHDILIGEVWLCSGQSNMAMMLGPDYPPGNNNWFGEEFWSQDSKQADRPGIRLFNVEKTASATPQKDCKGVLPDHIRQPADANGLIPEVMRGWQPCTRATAVYFSAVAYHFGITIQQALDVPVGLIGSHVGATVAESWTSLDGLHTLPDHANDGTEPGRNGRAALYNGMIAPLTPLRIKGCIWYQGESNHGLTTQAYATVFKTLITDWRKQFGQDDMPFYFVQLAPYNAGDDDASGNLRAGQAAALELPHTGMAVISDVAEPGNIHPKNKRDVGRRLAYQALRKTYGQSSVIADGPAPASVARHDAVVNITFTDTGGGLVASDGKPLNCFALAGADGVFHPASAALMGEVVSVTSPQVGSPKVVRFAWGSGDVPNLMSKDGLPVAQFRKDVP